jgi:hypothetical protein
MRRHYRILYNDRNGDLQSVDRHTSFRLARDGAKVLKNYGYTDILIMRGKRWWGV